MKKIIFLAILIAALAAFFASSHPDGLDKVAESFGFAEKAIDHPAFMTGYSLPFLPAGHISTAAAGIIGVLFFLGLFQGIKIFFSAR